MADRKSTKAKVLIVDDVPANITILAELLKADYSVVAATSGKRALALAAKAPPDIVLLDVMMPEMDGYEVFERLRDQATTRNVPIIFVTALSEEEDEAKGLGLGAADYITKPFRPAIVKQRIRNHLELKRYQDDLEGLVREQVQEIDDSYRTTILAFSKLAESRDDDTGKHLERTQIYCKMLAQELRKNEKFAGSIDDEFVDTIFMASPLHDIGKVAIPDNILKKPGKLTSEEFAEMQEHTIRGAETIDAVADEHPNNYFLHMGLRIARSHHEKWNGKGYPDGIEGEDIPLAARLMAVADVYDALTSKRCYKDAFSHEKAVEIILKDSGTHFDPDVVKAFENQVEAFDSIRAGMQNAG